MPDDQETLTDLLRANLSGDSGLTFREFHARAVDPVGGYRPSPRITHNLREGRNAMINPALVRALAAGLGLPLERVQRAAARQFIIGP